ncbi:hypothetical protein CIHG_00789 [Coccidioides immitis H538.4]|uniref:Uncharacterized protein n=2 Tax=Coccidioides immitis TaxID=5501 RepID=A0A0J8RDK4_COCIT|nr:hypothetical protein CIRG_03207 [Coccidioides immitis RMSCC 2394]KMU83007.1 hypothetical protein CIHG_00789 [Coccidioides immitis H538.4]
MHLGYERVVDQWLDGRVSHQPHESSDDISYVSTPAAAAALLELSGKTQNISVTTDTC